MGVIEDLDQTMFPLTVEIGFEPVGIKRSHAGQPNLMFTFMRAASVVPAEVEEEKKQRVEVGVIVAVVVIAGFAGLICMCRKYITGGQCSTRKFPSNVYNGQVPNQGQMAQMAAAAPQGQPQYGQPQYGQPQPGYYPNT